MMVTHKCRRTNPLPRKRVEGECVSHRVGKPARRVPPLWADSFTKTARPNTTGRWLVRYDVSYFVVIERLNKACEGAMKSYGFLLSGL